MMNSEIETLLYVKKEYEKFSPKLEVLDLNSSCSTKNELLVLPTKSEPVIKSEPEPGNDSDNEAGHRQFCNETEAEVNDHEIVKLNIKREVCVTEEYEYSEEEKTSRNNREPFSNLSKCVKSQTRTRSNNETVFKHIPSLSQSVHGKTDTCNVTETCYTSAKKPVHRPLRIRAKSKPYKCSKCEYRSVNIYALRKHLITHMDEKPYKCPKCIYSASRKLYLEVHMKTHSNSSYKCSLCEYTASHKSTLTKHFNVIHLDLPA